MLQNMYPPREVIPPLQKANQCTAMTHILP